MKLYTYTLLFLIIFIKYSYSQTEPKLEPLITFPNSQFNSLYEQEKVLNPIYLNGKVNTVMKTFKQHFSPYNTDEYTTHYGYKLNKAQVVIDYRSDLEYDELTKDDLNKAIKLKPLKKDTLVERGNTKYVFKKGQLVLKEEQNYEDGFIDSIVFKYKNKLLVEKIHYASIGMDVVNDDGDIDENSMLFTEFEIKSYSKIDYNKTGLIVSYKHYQPNPDIVEVTENKYHYNSKGQLENYTLVYNRYYAETIDVYSPPNTWQFNKEGIIKEFFEETKGSYKYDTKGRIIAHYLNKENKEAEYYNVNYKTDGHIISVVKDYYIDYNYETLQLLNLEYEYIYDDLKNPIHIRSYIIKKGKKYLDKSTRLTINYYE